MTEMDNLALAMKASDQATKLLESDLGRSITRRCEQSRAALLESLLGCHPWDQQRIQSIQNEIRVIDLAMTWLADVLTTGAEAHARLAQLEQED